jgi:hypothetical protein
MSKRSASDQNPAAHQRLRDGIWRILAIALVMLLLVPTGVPNVQAQQLIQVPAEFVQFLRPPGALDQILRPSALHADRRNGEILVGDPGNSRIVIFDSSGTYRFEFAGMDHFSVPLDLTVEPEGFILVLASTREGLQLQRYDFDGVYIGTLDLGNPDAARTMSSVDVDDEGRIYLLHGRASMVTVHDPEGREVDRFALEVVEDEDSPIGTAFGEIRVVGEKIYVPVSSMGTVQSFSLEGEPGRNIGTPGTIAGTLGFPVAVDVASDGTILVLDQNRFSVLCYDRWGKFLGEFGGKGYSPGWFYFPSLLAVDETDQVYVGQILDNRLQVCRIPDVIRPEFRRPEPEAEPHGPSDGGSGVGWFDTELPARSFETKTAAYCRTLASGRSDGLSLMTPAFYQNHFGGGQ